MSGQQYQQQDDRENRILHNLHDILDLGHGAFCHLCHHLVALGGGAYRLRLPQIG